MTNCWHSHFRQLQQRVLDYRSRNMQGETCADTSKPVHKMADRYFAIMIFDFVTLTKRNCRITTESPSIFIGIFLNLGENWRYEKTIDNDRWEFRLESLIIHAAIIFRSIKLLLASKTSDRPVAEYLNNVRRDLSFRSKSRCDGFRRNTRFEWLFIALSRTRFFDLIQTR